MTAFVPTHEQALAAEYFADGCSLRIEALAGTGKTSTLLHLVSHPDRPLGKILYTAFGAKVIAEAKERMPRHVTVKTNHGLAWWGFGSQYNSAGRLRGKVIATNLRERFRWPASRFGAATESMALRGVLDTLRRFCNSADPQITRIHAMPSAARVEPGNARSAADHASLFAALAQEVWTAWEDPADRLPVTHDVYLKRWALSRPRLPFDIILLDEAQDANPVMVDVLLSQEHAQMVVVGDRRQAIFGFRGAIDAMDAFELEETVTLRQSFRFGPAIAAIGNAVLSEHCEAEVELLGHASQPGRVGRLPSGPHTLLARRNATLVDEVVSALVARPPRRVGVVGGVDELVALLKGAEQLRAGIRTPVPDLAEFSTWQEVVDAAADDAYMHLRRLVKLVMEYGTQRLIPMLESIAGNESDESRCDIVLSTAHRAKGREWPRVRLADDFPVKGPPDDPGADGWTPEEGNLLYVAVTRAREVLDVEECEAVHDAWGHAPFPQDR